MVGQLQRIPGTFVLSSADSIQGGYDMYSIAEICSMVICCGHIRTVVFDFSGSNRVCGESALPINGPLGLVFLYTTNHERKKKQGWGCEGSRAGSCTDECYRRYRILQGLPRKLSAAPPHCRWVALLHVAGDLRGPTLRLQRRRPPLQQPACLAQLSRFLSTPTVSVRQSVCFQCFIVGIIATKL